MKKPGPAKFLFDQSRQANSTRKPVVVRYRVYSFFTEYIMFVQACKYLVPLVQVLSNFPTSQLSFFFIFICIYIRIYDRKQAANNNINAEQRQIRRVSRFFASAEWSSLDQITPRILCNTETLVPTGEERAGTLNGCRVRWESCGCNVFNHNTIDLKWPSVLLILMPYSFSRAATKLSTSARAQIDDSSEHAARFSHHCRELSYVSMFGLYFPGCIKSVPAE